MLDRLLLIIQQCLEQADKTQNVGNRLKSALILFLNSRRHETVQLR